MTKGVQTALRKGVVDMLPLSFAVLPWGILFGSIAVQRGFSWFEAQMFSALIFGGAVQIVTVELIADNVSLLTILFTAFVISSRHFLYGLSLRERLSPQPLKWRLGLGFLLTDELFAVSGAPSCLSRSAAVILCLGCGRQFLSGMESLDLYWHCRWRFAARPNRFGVGFCHRSDVYCAGYSQY